MGLIIDVFSWVLIGLGSLFMIVGGIGLLRFPDFWTRLHAVSIKDSGGMLLLIAGLVLQAGPNLIAAKLVLIGIFLFITGPTASHAVANAALVSGMLPYGQKKPSAPTQEECQFVDKAGDAD